MKLYEKAVASVPLEELDEIIKEWKKQYPNPHSYLKLRGGHTFVQDLASELNWLGLPFTLTNSPLTFLFGDDTLGPNDYIEDPPDKRAEIRFLSLPDSFTADRSLVREIKLYNGVICFGDVPVPVLRKMFEMGVLQAR